MLDGLQNFLGFLDQNWMSILVIIGLIVGIIKKTKDYFSKSDEEKIEIVKRHIQEIMLKLITDAECDYESLKQSGSIKRAQVIKKIFEEYPILSKVADQDALIKWLDEMIDDSLVVLREIVENNGGSITANGSSVE